MRTQRQDLILERSRMEAGVAQAYAILCHLPRRVSETTICRLAKQIGLLRKPMPEQLAETLETFPLLAKNLHGLSLLFFERMSRAG